MSCNLSPDIRKLLSDTNGKAAYFIFMKLYDNGGNASSGITVIKKNMAFDWQDYNIRSADLLSPSTFTFHNLLISLLSEFTGC